MAPRQRTVDWPGYAALGNLAFARTLIGAEYQVRAQVVHVASNAWVIYFGAPAFQDAAPPAWVENGGCITGRIYVGIDPFFYFEGLKDVTGMPNLFRDWQVRKILLETTPWKETITLTGGKLVVRENSVPTFVEVQHTNAWSDDGGHAHYILECELIGAG